MATAKRDYKCRYCQQPAKGYQVWKRHERECPLNPANTEHAVEPVTEPGPDVVPVIKGLGAVAPSEGQGIENLVALEVAKHLMVFDQRFGELENSMGGKLQRSVDMIQSEIAKVPKIIEDSVGNYMVAKLGEPPAPPPGDGSGQAPNTPAVQQPGKGLLSGLASQIDLGQIFMEYLKAQGGGNINTAIANMFLKQMKSKKSGPDAKYTSRGMGHFMSAIRNKKVDPDAQAMSLRAMAVEMLNDKNLAPDSRGYFIGIKSGADAFMEGRAIEQRTKVIEIPEAQPEVPPIIPQQEV